MNALIRALEAKLSAQRRLESLLSREEARAAGRDHHARRRPIGCGMTVHTGIGCPVGCAYCYIYSMGFPKSATPYPLEPLQMAYALAANPYVAVGERGTLIAVGSVTEPFLPTVKGRALGYLKALSEYLGNPIQVSTKMRPPLELAEVQRGLDVLISVVDSAGRLEPGAPKPLERLEAGAELIKRGVSVTLFVRPIIPGVTDADIDRLLETAYGLGYRRVVFGTLRVTPSIVERLRAFGVDVEPYAAGLKGEREQTPIRYPKDKFIERAARGFQVLPASCSANVTAHGQACALCRWGPCGDVEKLNISQSDVEEFLEARGYRGRAEVRGFTIKVKTAGRLREVDRIFIEQSTRMRVVKG